MVLHKISHRVIRTLRRLGYLEAGMDVAVATGYDPLLDNEPELARSMAASVRQRIAFGERAGENVRRIGSGFGYEGERPELKGPCGASVNGFSLHANTAIPAHRRDQLERLMRYTGRGAVSLERLEQDVNGDLMYRFTRPWSDGTTGIKLAPLELLEKLAACPPGALRRMFGAAQHAPGCDYSHTAPTGCRRRCIEDGNPVLELGKAAGSSLRCGYGDLSILPLWLPAHHCRHHA
jgi:hypothetical protein